MDLGGLQKVRTPPGKEGVLDNTDSISQFPGLMLHGCHVTASVFQHWDGQQKSKKAYVPQKAHRPMAETLL